ncbi:hypothetical protein I6J18_15470 [Peribacillus psychrosaccharolyticus]|uniref:Uncharacterized protein n=1 Tax=Peribacillus psychrosaccharolyticus TaxID=1407 RepID=A0A974NJW6_PERPY|nr:hypothetical protein [Peribacillus psychrosaccharolyticus]MEC2055348.1 hypothetical protein [Peribacillus psychrosaccharolyticus]MED3745338.1 hypothetical protein [Peribacillus psychrosaccharolyticus]QQS99039.1 hypothetical protein I6J18_15470 [Peribacillus psychrosaccharolyticus]
MAPASFEMFGDGKMNLLKKAGILAGCLFFLYLIVKLYEYSLGSISFFLLAIIFFIAAYRLNK